MGSRWPESWLGSSSGSEHLLLAAGALIVSALAAAASATLASLGEHRVAGIFEDHRQGQAPRGLGVVFRRYDAVRLSLLTLDGVARIGLGASLALWAQDRVVPFSWAIAAGAVLVALVAIASGRAFALRNAERSLVLLAPFAATIDLVLRPLTGPLAALSRAIRGKEAGGDTTEELEYLIEKGTRAGELEKTHSDLLESVIDFSRVRVREIMVPRPKVVALPADATYDDVVQVVIDSAHSRLPVYRESIDDVIGVLYAKKLLADLTAQGADRKAFRLADAVQPAFFVPETMKISHLLGEFQRRSQQLAVVVDEFGGTSGIVTLEDVVEEIVGDIRDEGDLHEQAPIRQLAPGLFLAEGEASVRDVEYFLEEALDGQEPFEFPDEGDYETIGGFVTSQAGRVPRVGETVEYDHLLFTVRSADERRVARVEIAVQPDRPRRENGRGDTDREREREERFEAPEEKPQGRALAREAAGIEGSTFLSRFVGLRRDP